jgi:hypothetical protein
MIHALVKPAVHLIASLMARPGRLAVRLVEIVAFESVWPPREGVYLTDGTLLFQLQCVLPDRTGKRLLALEDCRTLELIYCAPGALYGQRFRLVNAPTPAESETGSVT